MGLASLPAMTSPPRSDRLSVMPLLSASSLDRVESNVRSATVVGMVGAGGIGVTLWEAIRGFQFQQTCALMVLIIVTVSLLDFLSQRLRKHFI